LKPVEPYAPAKKKLEFVPRNQRNAVKDDQGA